MIYNANELLSIRDYFDPLHTTVDRAFVAAAEALERSAKIEEHPFFALARQNRQALVLWASQEAIVTNPFSQILFRVLSNIKNVHVRSILLPVVLGEHSELRNGVADKSHPWLIWNLCRSLGLSEADIKPTGAVVNFISVLEAVVDCPMRALGSLGVGNELMLLAEYRAVETCFDLICPEADYKEFLHANISEDEAHTALIGKAAASLTNLGYASEDFIEGAREGVNARVAYYDALLAEVS
ncbi:MAG: iron-containing redox enzyme family protein [Pyrinomonadaceae bacterium]